MVAFELIAKRPDDHAWVVAVPLHHIAHGDGIGTAAILDTVVAILVPAECACAFVTASVFVRAEVPGWCRVASVVFE